MGGLVAFIYGVALFGSTYLLPVFMQEALHLAPSLAGAVLLPAGIALALTIPFAGRLADRMPVNRLVSFGLLLLSVSFFLMLAVGLGTALVLIMLWALIGRIGLGFIMPALNLGSMRGLPRHPHLARLEHDQLPAPARRRGRHRPGRQRPRMAAARPPGAPLSAYHQTFGLIGAITACAIVAAALMGPRRPQDAAPTAAA